MSKNWCQECEEETTHDNYGVVPFSFISGSREDDIWVDTNICIKCGFLSIRDVTEDDVEQAEVEYVNFLRNNDIISEKDAEYYLDEGQK